LKQAFSVSEKDERTFATNLDSLWTTRDQVVLPFIERTINGAMKEGVKKDGFGKSVSGSVPTTRVAGIRRICLTLTMAARRVVGSRLIFWRLYKRQAYNRAISKHVKKK
jgi:hypothetical protein